MAICIVCSTGENQPAECFAENRKLFEVGEFVIH